MFFYVEGSTPPTIITAGWSRTVLDNYSPYEEELLINIKQNIQIFKYMDFFFIEG